MYAPVYYLNIGITLGTEEKGSICLILRLKLMYSSVKAIYYLSPCVHLVYEQSHLFTAMEKCIKRFTLKETQTLRAKRGRYQRHVLPPRGWQGPIVFWNSAMTRLAYLNITTPLN